MRKIFWGGVLVFLVTTAVLLIDIREALYMYFWVDIVEHLLGGVLAGLIGMWWALALVKRATLAHALIGALVLGILVEVVEYVFGWGISVHMSRPLDTLKDILIDLLGGWVAWRVARKTI